MGYSRSQAPPLTEQDLCKPKFSLLVEKVRSSLDYNAVDEVRSVQRLKYCERECRRTVIGETIFQV